MEDNSNRVKRLNESTKQLLEVVRKVNDVESAEQYMPKIKAIADEIRGINDQIAAARSKNKKPGGAMITQHKEWKANTTMLHSIDRKLERLSSDDAEAADMVRTAIDGIRNESVSKDVSIL